MIDAPENAVLAGGLEPAWIDERLPDDARVTKLYLESTACPASSLTRHALFATEFFNVTVDRAAYIGDSIPDGIPLDRVEVVDGRLVFEDGTTVRRGLRLHAAGHRAPGRSASPRARPRGSCSGRRAARSGWWARRRRTTSAPPTARSGEASLALPNPLR